MMRLAPSHREMPEGWRAVSPQRAWAPRGHLRTLWDKAPRCRPGRGPPRASPRWQPILDFQVLLSRPPHPCHLVRAAPKEGALVERRAPLPCASFLCALPAPCWAPSLPLPTVAQKSPCPSQQESPMSLRGCLQGGCRDGRGIPAHPHPLGRCAQQSPQSGSLC